MKQSQGRVEEYLFVAAAGRTMTVDSGPRLIYGSSQPMSDLLTNPNQRARSVVKRPAA